MRRSTTYAISRIDQNVTRTHSWLVRLQRRGRIYNQHFSDRVMTARGRAGVFARVLACSMAHGNGRARSPPLGNTGNGALSHDQKGQQAGTQDVHLIRLIIPNALPLSGS
jgi:hypothetical protein